jgi:DNA-binding transcriptional ArsR family regulator
MQKIERESLGALLNLKLAQTLSAFSQPVTAAEAARKLGVKPNRLGHRVRTLKKLGLLREAYRSGRKVYLQAAAERLELSYSEVSTELLERTLNEIVKEFEALIRAGFNQVLAEDNSDKSFFFRFHSSHPLPARPRLLPLTYLGQTTLTPVVLELITTLIQEINKTPDTGSEAGQKIRLGLVVVDDS